MMIMNKQSFKLMAATAVVACAFGAIAMRTAQATPPTPGFVSTPIVGPVSFDDIQTVHQTRDWGIFLKTRGESDVYVNRLTLAPGANGGWHSHPGPSIISVKSGTATFYDECDDFIPHHFPSGTGFVEDAECVHILRNEGDVTLEVIVMQIVPQGAPRRIDEADPRD
jgi:quercetin dioxygenase-like cupin family protein